VFLFRMTGWVLLPWNAATSPRNRIMTGQYATRTCVDCGLRDIQPRMHRCSVTYRSGMSRDSVHGGTLFGALFGNEKSVNRLKKVALHNGKRSYRRTRQVWKCPSCAGTNVKLQTPRTPNKKGSTLSDLTHWFILYPIYVILAASLCIGIAEHIGVLPQ
jgi:hypothetical protein